MCKSALDYAMAACDTLMRTYQAKELPPAGRFHYHQGVFLSGMYQTYLLTGKEDYFAYIKAWVDSIIDEKGAIHAYDPGQLDDIQPGVLLFPLYEKTGDPRYRTALLELMAQIRDFPKNKCGGFWHKKRYPNQMWLDGLYMAGPIAVLYAGFSGEQEYADNAVRQALLMQEKTRDLKTGLWYHAWDASGQADWANPETGLAPEFWGRSMGWVPAAVLNELEALPQDYAARPQLEALVRELLQAVCRYQSEDGRWYQVVDKGGAPGNWLETSCSCLFTAAICRAVRSGILDASYLEQAQKGYQGVLRSLTWSGEDLQIGGICVGTCVGDYDFYCARPRSVNDLHGVGAFLLMCAAVSRAGLDGA